MIQVIDSDTRAKLAALAGSVRSAAARAEFRGAAREVAMAGRAEAPKRTGRLRSALQWFLTRRVAPEALAKITYKKAPHAHLVIRGTAGRRVARDRFMRFRPRWRRGWVFARSVAPMPKNDFWGRAIASRAPSAVRDLVTRLRSAVERQAKGGGR